MSEKDDARWRSDEVQDALRDTMLEELQDKGNLLTFLQMAGQGCISGKVSEWPQLKPACKWAAAEIKKLRSELSASKVLERVKD